MLGEVLPARSPAAALAGFEIDTAHAEVITRASSTAAARRIDPGGWPRVTLVGGLGCE